MKKMLTLAGVSVMALSLGTGVASANHGAVTGPDSDYKVEIRERLNSRVENNNRIQLDNDTYQKAYSGDAKVKYNTSGGSATTGHAVNDNLTRAEVRVNNQNSNNQGQWKNFGGSGGANTNHFPEVTGPGSDFKYKYNRSVDLRVQNNNNIDVDNNTYQKAASGDATVKYNTYGGNARTGNAENINTTSLNVRVDN